MNTIIQNWKASDGSLYAIVLDDVEFTCSYVKLPIFVNENLELSEFGLIHLLNIYSKFIEFIELGRSKKLEEEPYCVVVCLDKVSELFMAYLNNLHLTKYGIDTFDYSDLDIKIKTPYCQYVYEAAKEKLNIIEDVLRKERGLVKDTNFIDTDWE